MIDKPKAIFFVAPSYKLKTGYYFRVQRDKEQFKKEGYDVIIYDFLNIFKNFNLRHFFEISLKSEVLVAQNTSMIVPIMLLNFFKKISTKKTILVLHGSLKELDVLNTHFLKRFFYPLLLKFALKNFKTLIVVSNKMKKDLLSDYGQLKIDTYVMPNIPSKEFFDECYSLKKKDIQEIRNTIDLPQTKFVITYAGNMQEWQKVDLLLESFNALLKFTDKFYLNILTKEVSKFKQSIIDHNITSNFHIREVENKDIPKYLISSDILWALRDENKINQVSCPTKILEYICSGNQIIISNGIGDLSEFIEKDNRGVVVKKENMNAPYIADLLFSLMTKEKRGLMKIPQIYSYETNETMFKKLLLKK